MTPTARERLAPLKAKLNRFLAAYGEREVPMRAAALTYYAFFTLFPLLLLAATVVGYLVAIDAELAQRLRHAMVLSLQEVMPQAGTTVNQTLNSLAGSATPLGIVGVIGLLWGATGSVNAVGSAINRIFDPTAPMPGWVQRLKAGLAIAAIGGLAISINLAGIVLPLIAASIGIVPPAVILRLSLQFVGAAVAFLLMYRLLPTRPPSWGHAVEGGLVGAGLFTVLQVLFSLYLRFVSFDKTFGAALAGVAVLFVWLNWSALVFLAGALVAASLSESNTDVQLPGERLHLAESEAEEHHRKSEQRRVQ